MKFHVLTLFPEMIENAVHTSITMIIPMEEELAWSWNRSRYTVPGSL